MAHELLLYRRLNALVFTLTPLLVNVRIFPALPVVDELPVKWKVPGAHCGGGGLRGVGVTALLAKRLPQRTCARLKLV